MYPQSPSKWQLSEQERRGEITPAEYYRALQERSDALNFAAKRKPGGKKKESGSKDNPKCKTGNYQCRGSNGVACISKKKDCRADMDKQVVSPERKQYINDTIEKLKEAGKSPPKVRIGRKLGAPITDISWEQYAKALELNVSGRKLSVGDATREQLKAIGVDVDGLTAKPAQGKKEELPQKVKSETRKALELNGFKFAGSLYKGQELSDGIDRLADKIEREALEIRSGAPYASHVTEATKDEILAQDMKRAQALRDGLITDFTTMQRLAFEISGEDVPLLAPPEPTQPQTKLQKAAAEKAARSVEDMATQMSYALRNGSALPETVKAIANDPDTDPDRRAAARQALAAANRARELDPKFEMVGSNFVDLDNPAEVEQLRRFYGGEAVGKSDGIGVSPSLDVSQTKSGRPIPERARDWMSKQPAWDLPKWMANDPVANLLVRSAGETLSSVVFNGMSQAATVTRLNPPSKKYPHGSVSLTSTEPNGGRAVLNFVTLKDLLSTTDGKGLPGDPSDYSFSEPLLWRF